MLKDIFRDFFKPFTARFHARRSSKSRMNPVKDTADHYDGSGQRKVDKVTKIGLGVGLDGFPNEVLEKILGHLVRCREEPVEESASRRPYPDVVRTVDKAAISTVSLVSRRWRALALPHLFHDVVFKHSTIRPNHDLTSFERFLTSHSHLFHLIVNLSLIDEHCYIRVDDIYSTAPSVGVDFLSRFENLDALVLVNFVASPIRNGIGLNVRSLAVTGYNSSSRLWTTLSCFSTVKRLRIHDPRSAALADEYMQPGNLNRLHVSELVLSDILHFDQVLPGLLQDSATGSVSVRTLTVDMAAEVLEINSVNGSLSQALRILSKYLIELHFPSSGPNFHLEHIFQGLVWTSLKTISIDIILEGRADQNWTLLRRVADLLGHFADCQTIQSATLTFRRGYISFSRADVPDQWTPELHTLVRRLLDISTITYVQVQSDGHPIADAMQSLLASAWQVHAQSAELALARVEP